MQLNIEITDINLQEKITQYISKKQIEANDLLIELLRDFFNKNENNIYKLSKEEIRKTVENSQLIEGYEPVSQEVTKRVKEVPSKKVCVIFHLNFLKPMIKQREI